MCNKSSYQTINIIFTGSQCSLSKGSEGKGAKRIGKRKRKTFRKNKTTGKQPKRFIEKEHDYKMHTLHDIGYLQLLLKIKIYFVNLKYDLKNNKVKTNTRLLQQISVYNTETNCCGEMLWIKFVLIAGLSV